jgi:hypothetical protein
MQALKTLQHQVVREPIFTKHMTVRSCCQFYTDLNTTIPKQTKSIARRISSCKAQILLGN